MDNGVANDLKWGCPLCTFLNPAKDDKCMMCETARPLDSYRVMEEIRQQETEAILQQQSQEFEDRLEMQEMERASTQQSNWSEGDFGGDDEDWGDDDGDTEMKDVGNDDDEWGDDDLVEEDHLEEIKVPEKQESFVVLSPHDLRKYQVEILRSIQEVLDFEDLEDVAILCRKFRWNRAKLMEEYPVNPDKVMAEAGLVSQNPNKHLPSGKEFDCFLCICTVPIDQTFHMGCGHVYCHGCWGNYLKSEMEKGPRVIYTRCIDPKCKLVVKPKVFDRFLTYKFKEKYQEYLLHSFVEGMKNLQWCPGTDCQFAARAEFGSSYSIACKCQHVWCFACRVKAHAPCSCELTEKWLKLCSTDSENITYIRAFTKMCPKCKSQIEKNQGCNHMTCRCGYEFCWLCKKDWKKTGYGHTCNKPSDIVKLEEEANKAKSHLQRYGFYFSRYEAHEKSLETALKSYRNAEQTVRDFILKRPNMKYHDLEFITDAMAEILLTKRVLSWSYCYGYYLKDKTFQKDLFQTQQGLLESFADQLHEKAEQRLDAEDTSKRDELLEIDVRSELINLTQTVSKYRKNLTAALAEASFVFEPGI